MIINPLPIRGAESRALHEISPHCARLPASTEMKGPPARKLQRAHFAFMRALLQGLDERASWDRYLRSDGEAHDRRIVRQTIAWIKDEFAAAARRHSRPGTARLVRLDPENFSPKTKLPTLEDFALERGLEDFSEAEQAQAYAEAFPDAGAGRGGQSRPTQRARIVTRQLEALRWLESQAVRDPRGSDSVNAWLNPAVAQRMERTGLTTLTTLVDHINANGARWWRTVPGVGTLKAARVVEWLKSQEAVTGLRIGDHALVPRAQVPSAWLEQVVPCAAALVPWEKFRVPDQLSGQLGQFRAPPSQCLISATSDRAAISAWLAAKGGRAPEGAMSATSRAYRKEAERLLLWSVLVRRKEVSSLTEADVLDDCEFLRAPPPEWCGARHHQRWSPEWRPLEGGLSPSARRHAVTVLRSLFGFLLAMRYIVRNPFAGPAVRQAVATRPAARRTLSQAQWEALDQRLSEVTKTPAAQRSVRTLRWIHATGLRLPPLAKARCGGLLSLSAAQSGERASSPSWVLQVERARGEPLAIRLPLVLVQELDRDLIQLGFAQGLSAPEARQLPILGRLDEAHQTSLPATPSGLAKAMKVVLRRAAANYPAAERAEIERVSANTLRRLQRSRALAR